MELAQSKGFADPRVHARLALSTFSDVRRRALTWPVVRLRVLRSLLRSGLTVMHVSAHNPGMEHNDLYPWTEGPVVETECDWCHHRHVCLRRPDPFLEEVYPEDAPYPESWWCGTCYQDRKDDI